MPAGRKRRVQERVLPPRGLRFHKVCPQPSSYMRSWEWCELKINLRGESQMTTEELIQRYVRPEQIKGRRRKPFGYHRRVVYL